MDFRTFCPQDAWDIIVAYIGFVSEVRQRHADMLLSSWVNACDPRNFQMSLEDKVMFFKYDLLQWLRYGIKRREYALRRDRIVYKTI